MMVGFVVDRFMGKRMVGDVEECDECGRWRGVTLKLIVDADISGGVFLFFLLHNSPPCLPHLPNLSPLATPSNNPL